jgi:Ala-tRNA(Pro) deacylase
MNEKVVFDFLENNQIKYQLFKHQPVFKAEDKPVLIDSPGIDVIPGLQSKTLFLKDKKTGAFFLVSVPEQKRVDLKALSDLLGCNRFSFGKEEELLEILKLTPGSVTPFGLLFDDQKKVTFVLDEEFLKACAVTFHPMRNDMTVALAPQDFLKCMEKIEHQPKIIQIPTQK